MKIIKILCCMVFAISLSATGYAAEEKNPSASSAQADDSTATPKTDQEDKNTTDETASSDAADDESRDDTDDDSDHTAIDTSKDPLEGFNRAMFTFNDKLDIYIMKPIATFYNKIMPKPLNKGIHNFFFNIGTVTTIADDLLQANFYQATNDIWRLGINTTIGIGGLFDVAERMQLEPYQNDFGMTLARWGWTNSTYLVLPFFGPNTIRDGIGIPVDYFALSVYPYIQPERTRYELLVLNVIDRRAQLLKFQEVLEEAALDRYVFMRNAYLQRRTYLIEQNNHRGLFDREAIDQEPSNNYD